MAAEHEVFILHNCLICELLALACAWGDTRPPEGGMSESQSWVTAKAQDMFQKTGNWSPDRPYADDLHDNRHNPQVRACTHALPPFLAPPFRIREVAAVKIKWKHLQMLKQRSAVCGSQLLLALNQNSRTHFVTFAFKAV